jgi:alanine-synthesizing transaminase
MKSEPRIRPSDSTRNVRYEIRGGLARRALELERQGYEIVSLNIGNPAAYHQKGIFPAREAVVLQQQGRGVKGVSSDQVFMGNGVSELIDLVLRALLNSGDEVLVPAPDYPLWSAAVTLNGGKAVHYPCRPENKFHPDPDEVAALITPRTRAIVIINPNNPTGAVYPRAVLEKLARLAESHQLVVFSDEIYDGMTYDGAESIPMATLVHDTLCATMSGLSKIYRACGFRVGWASFSGATGRAAEYLAALELLSSLRLCSNVPGQWAVASALGGYQSIQDLINPGGRLYESRRAIIEAVARSRYLSLTPPSGALYGFIRVRTELIPHFNDQEFALELLEQKHVLIAPGASFNVPYKDHFRVTILPDARTLTQVFGRIDAQLDLYAARAPANSTERVVDASSRFK